MTNGTWVLPDSPEHQNLLAEIAAAVRGQGGAAFLFSAQSLSLDEDAAVRLRFAADRSNE